MMVRKLLLSRPVQRLGKALMLLLGGFGLLLCLAVTVLIFVQGLPLFLEQGPVAVLLGTTWRPHAGLYGMLPLLLATLYSMLGAMVLAIPFGIFTALFVSRVLPKRFYRPVATLLMIMARIPSVIYGLLGIVVLLPWLQTGLGMPTGYSLLALILVLAALLVPSLTMDLLVLIQSVPRQIEYSSRALGASGTETWVRAILPHIRLGIVTAVFTTAGRAVGETIVVAMVAGSVANLPRLTGNVSTLALEASGTFVGLDGESGRALFAVAVVLYLLSALLYLVRRLIVKWGWRQ